MSFCVLSCLFSTPDFPEIPFSDSLLARNQYSGKHHRVVKGINIVNHLWTNGEKMIPIDYRIYDTTTDGKTKNDHAREMLHTAEKRGFHPLYVLFDSWYSCVGNLKAIARKGWQWIGALKSNRLVSIVQGTYKFVSNRL